MTLPFPGQAGIRIMSTESPGLISKQSPEQKIEQLIILGTGPAGLTAAIYCARANLSPICVEGVQPGGQLTITSEVENYPGFAEPVMGPDLMTAFRKQAERFGTRFHAGDVVEVNLTRPPYSVSLADGRVLQARAIIIATGASAKWIGLENEKRLMGKGVSGCATCDGFFFRNLDVAVVGGGDTALEEATFLTRFARSVTLIHRRGQLRASQAMQDRARKNPKIKMVYHSVVEDILGEKAVTGVKLKQLETGESSTLEVQGVFVAIGHHPNTKAFQGQLAQSEQGYLKVHAGSSRTEKPGVFAAGDVADAVYRQAITAAGSGCMAAMDAERYLETLDEA